MTGPEGFARATFSADGRRLAAEVRSADERKVVVWDVESLKRTVTVAVSRQRSPVSLSPDFSLLASSGPEKAVTLTDIQTGMVVARLAGQPDLSAIAWAPNGQTLAVGRQDGTVSVWSRDK